MPTVHAKLSASGAHKWLYAPTTLWMEEGLPDFTSRFAAEGTAAHTLVELKLKRANGQITKSQYDRRFKTFTESSDYYSKAMADYTDAHVDLVVEAYHKRKNAAFLSSRGRLSSSVTRVGLPSGLTIKSPKTSARWSLPKARSSLPKGKRSWGL